VPNFFSRLKYLAAIFIFVARGAHAETQYVGILENYSSDGANIGGSYARVAFKKTPKGWESMPTAGQVAEDLPLLNAAYPANVEWNIAYDGKFLGKVLSTNAPYRYWSEMGRQELPDAFDPPIKPLAVEKFSRSMAQNQARSRPLLLNSRPYCDDPEAWKLTQLAASEKKVLIAFFRKKVPKIFNCKDVHSESGKLENYRDKDLDFDFCFRSARGGLLCGLNPSQKLYRCDGPITETYFERWFYIAKGKRPQEIEKNLIPVEAADLDHDGHSEWLFYKNAYNTNGYVLFYDNFTKSALFEWHYH
jgi:hypothetical protein